MGLAMGFEDENGRGLHNDSKPPQPNTDIQRPSNGQKEAKPMPTDNPNTIEDLLNYHIEYEMIDTDEDIWEFEVITDKQGLIAKLQRMQDEARLQEWESYIAAARQEFGEGVYPSREWENLYIKGRLEALRTKQETDR